MEVSISSGVPRRLVKKIATGGESMEDSLLRSCDKVVYELLKIPGFFAGKLSYLSNISGHKEIFVSNSLMTSSRPNTNFKKITFNASWGNQGRVYFSPATGRSLIIFFSWILLREKFVPSQITEVAI